MKRAGQALAAYTALALVATWPLARGLSRDVASDLGDPVLVIWALAWDCEQLLRILHGGFSRVGTFFDANIFYPSTLTLAYSEHFIAQALQVLPVFAVTHNAILCYNLLFLSTFALSGLGGFLFTRELTGSSLAGFVGGLLFAFAPYRITQSPHLQVLSSQWMPFALYGLRRFFVTGRWRPLVGGTAALVMQNLSCVYYLLYFSPFVAAYLLWEIASRRLWRSATTWRRLVIAGGAMTLCTLPFVLPYFAVQQQLRVERSRQEVMRYSADVYSYATAFAGQPIWGPIANTFHKPECDLFPGAVALLLALLGVVTARGGHARDAAGDRPAQGSPRRWAPALLITLAVVHLFAALVVLIDRRVAVDLGLFELRMRNIDQLLLRGLIAFVLLLIVSPESRARTGAFLHDRGFFLLAAVAAAWLSLGPAPQALGRPLELLGPYGVLMDHVPGFLGMRAPGRFGMIVVLMLAVLGAYGAAWLARYRRGRVALALACAIALAESVALPFPVNGLDAPAGFNAPEARLRSRRAAPAIYVRVRRLAETAVLAELPLGIPEFDRRAMYYSTLHWRRLLNGYSGFYPPAYGQLATALSDVPRHPGEAFATLRGAGATHVIVHEDAYLAGAGAMTTDALVQLGAVELDRQGGDVLLELPNNR